MTVSPEVTAAIEHVIRDAGYNIGTTTLVNPRTGETLLCRDCIAIAAGRRF